MRAKKLCAALVSGMMAIGMLIGLPIYNTTNYSETNVVMQALESLSLKAEPLTASAASSNFRRPVSNDRCVLFILKLGTPLTLKRSLI